MRSVTRTDGRRRGLIRIVVFVIIAATITDRIALYAWGYSVLRLHRWLCVPASGGAGVRSPLLGFGRNDEGRCAMNLLMLGSAVRPDEVRVGPSHSRSGDCTVSLLFLPPPLAWSTRVFPLREPSGSVRAFYYGYELRVTDSGTPGRFECKLYRAVYSERIEVAPGTRWPRFY